MTSRLWLLIFSHLQTAPSSVRHIIVYAAKIKIMSKEISRLETFGKISTLTPCSQKKMRKPLVFISLLVVVANSAWKWDTLELSKYTKNSDRIHYITFKLALWISYAVARLAFLISAPHFIQLYSEAKQYAQDFMHQDEKKVARRFKCISLIFLNTIFFGQILEFVIRHFFQENNPAELDHCERVLFPCKTFHWVHFGITAFFHVLDSMTLYYLTYFAITMSNFLIKILDHFQQKVVKRLDSSRGNVNIDFVTPIFILKQHGQPDKDGKVENSGIKGGQESDKTNIHAQFSRIKELFNSMNCAIGTPMIVSSFADILVMICIIYSFIPRLERGGYGGGGAGRGPYGGWGGGGGGDRGMIIPGGEEMQPGFNTTVDNVSNYTGTEYYENHVDGGYHTYGGAESYIPKSGYHSMQGIQFSYVFAVLYEARMLLVALVGTFLKFEVPT